MVKLGVSLLLTFLSSLIVAAQGLPSPQASPDPYEVQRTIRRPETGGQPRSRRTRSRNFNALDLRMRNALIHRHFRELYRKPDASETELLKPSAELRAKYKGFLAGDDSGLTVLAPNFDCARNANVINASERCVQFAFPGAGASYSFRYDAYRIPRLSDLTLAGARFVTVGDFTHGLIASIGDVPIEQLTTATATVRSLTSSVILRQDGAGSGEIAAVAIMQDGLTYGRSYDAIVDTTYLLRSVAFRGESMRVFEDVTYNEFDFDKRRDVVVAFRVVDIQSDGNVTIVWKKLSDVKAPSIPKQNSKEK